MAYYVDTKKVEEKISKSKCPFCQDTNWDIYNKTLGLITEEGLSNEYGGKSEVVVKAECKSCGYIAYFNPDKI